jgi:hypothetical protein
MNGTGRQKDRRAGSGPAKVFSLFPVVLISAICSVCYGMCAHVHGTWIAQRFRPPRIRLNEITR